MIEGGDVLSDRFLKQLDLLGVQLKEEQQEQFFHFYELLVEWNKVMNLTGITDYEEVNEKHFVDSLALAKVMDLRRVDRIIDIGTGAGFPGIPLKIVFPHLEVVLLDSLRKRVHFLDEVIQKLGLQKISTLHGRAEDYARMPEYREKFDLCVSRAVANLAVLSEYCIPYVRVGGYFVSYKSGNIDEEIKQAGTSIRVLGGNLEAVEKFCLPQSEIERSFVKIYKESSTKNKYPRKAGVPGKNPIL